MFETGKINAISPSLGKKRNFKTA
jgi:hypothetical protein